MFRGESGDFRDCMIDGKGQRGQNLINMVSRILFIIICIAVGSIAYAEDKLPVTIIYPKANSIVYKRVNLVLDPATDSSKIAFFQVIVNKRNEYPVVDLTTGKHASQGLLLDQGINTITVRVLTRSVDEKGNKTAFQPVSSREIRVFNAEGILPLRPPADFTKELFHSREREAECSGCHRLDVAPEDLKYKKPQDVLCYACHRNIPTGRHIHGPAAAWNCLSCHDPEIYPVKYQFNSADPWKVSKTSQTVEPMVYTYSSAEIFKPALATIISKDKAKDMLKDVLNYTKQNPGDKIRLEVHTDNTPPPKIREKVKGKLKVTGFKNNQALSAARAKTFLALLKESGVNMKNVTAVGMSDKLPKAPNKTPEGRELNNRIEIVVHPADVKVKNSQKLPVLKDRDRVLVNLSYAQGPQISKLTVVDKLPKGRQYLKGSGYFNGKTKEPRIKGDDLIWELGDMDANFNNGLFYVLRKGKDNQPIAGMVSVVYTAGSREMTRAFDPKVSEKRGLTVKESCLQCHGTTVDKHVKHGPADAGYCNSCHDPHASSHAAWLRKSAWDLCTTCHAEKGSGVHVVTGHPTRLKPDRMRPGKRLTCSSCHEPHSANSRDLFTYDVKTRGELCKLCHAK